MVEKTARHWDGKHCAICYPRVPNAVPFIKNDSTGKYFCKDCADMPGFWKMFWASRDKKVEVLIPVDAKPEDTKDAE